MRTHTQMEIHTWLEVWCKDASGAEIAIRELAGDGIQDN